MPCVDSGHYTIAPKASALQRQSGCDERDNHDEKMRICLGMIFDITGFCNI
jgi:hypothetical protein